MYHKQENCLDFCFLRLMFLLRDLFLFLFQPSLFKILFIVQETVQETLQSLFRVHSGRFLSDLKKRKISQNDHSLSFVVTRCHSLSFVVSRCTTRCTTRCLYIANTGCTTCWSLSLVVTCLIYGCHSFNIWLLLSYVFLLINTSSRVVWFYICVST